MPFCISGVRDSMVVWLVQELLVDVQEAENGDDFSIELLERLSIRLSKELSVGLSETAANIYKMIYADNYITRDEIANRIGISVTAVQKHINKFKSLRFIGRDGSTGHGNWIVIE